MISIYPLITLEALDKKYKGIMQDFLTQGEKYGENYIKIDSNVAKDIIAKYQPPQITVGKGGCCGG